MKSTHLKFLTEAAAIAALYTVLTLFSGAFGLAGGMVQLRLSEALTVLPFFTPAAIPGLTVGCVLGNLLTGSALWDVVFGSLATLLGALLSRAVRKIRWLVPVPPILANTLIVPLILRYVYGAEGTYLLLALSVGIGEVLSCGVLGTALLRALEPCAAKLFSR